MNKLKLGIVTCFLLGAIACSKDESTSPDQKALVSGTPGRISFAAPSVLADRSTITLTALDNTSFGSLGPILLFASDAKNTAPGMALESSDFDGVGVWNHLSGDGKQLMVEAVPELPQGKGFVIGTNGEGQNSSDYRGIYVKHPTRLETSKFYEHIVYYWPQLHQESAQAMLDENTIWQVKTIWPRYAHKNSKVEYKFHNSFGAYYGPGGYFKTSAVVSSGLDGTSWYPFASDKDINTAPSKSSYLRSDVMSQQTYTSIDIKNGFIKSYLRNKDTGNVAYGEFSGRTMVLNPPTPHIGPTLLTFPGFVRGFQISLGNYMYMADIFYQWGEGALARVEMTDSEDYATGNLVPCEVVKWTESEIEVKLRPGVFYGESFSGKWLHVHDSENTYIGAVQL